MHQTLAVHNTPRTMQTYVLDALRTPWHLHHPDPATQVLQPLTSFKAAARTPPLYRGGHPYGLPVAWASLFLGDLHVLQDLKSRTLARVLTTALSLARSGSLAAAQGAARAADEPAVA